MEPSTKPSTPPSASPSEAPRPSNPGLSAVRTATREAPLEHKPQGPLRERLKSGSLDVFLNTRAILRELLEDLRNRDGHFKVKAGILATWILLSVTSMAIACQPFQGFGNSLEAEWVLAGDDRRPVFSVYNQSDEPWQDVVVIINGTYRASQGVVAPGSSITLTPRQLMGNDGRTAPSDLKAHRVELRTSDGSQTLVADGQPR